MLRLALRNFFSAGLRTWLNIFVLSFAYVAIVWLQGIAQGLDYHSMRALIAESIGGGQIWHSNYDPYDQLTLEDSFAPLPGELLALQNEKLGTPVFLTTAVAYPYGNMQNVILRGIDPDQTILNLPTDLLNSRSDLTPVVIGSRMARNIDMQEGDRLMVRWRNRQGAFDARELRIAGVVNLQTHGIDSGQIWISLPVLREMMQAGEVATMMILSPDLDTDIRRRIEHLKPAAGNPADDNEPRWLLQTQYDLSEDIRQLALVKNIQYMFFYALLLFLAMISIFDTQVLALFRRRKEMGTLMSLGMTRNDLITLFTFEGGLYGIFAALLGAVYGVPLLVWNARHGIPAPEAFDSYGVAGITDAIYPHFQPGIIIMTLILVITVVTVVSYLPARKISRLRPTDALRGKWS